METEANFKGFRPSFLDLDLPRLRTYARNNQQILPLTAPHVAERMNPNDGRSMRGWRSYLVPGFQGLQRDTVHVLIGQSQIHFVLFI